MYREINSQALHNSSRHCGGINIDVFRHLLAQKHVARLHFSCNSTQAILVQVPEALKLFIVLFARFYIGLDDDVMKAGLAVFTHAVYRLSKNDAAAKASVAARLVHRDGVFYVVAAVPAKERAFQKWH